MSDRNPKIDSYVEKMNRWSDEIEILRDTLLQTELKEELKWGKPCYTYNNHPVAILYDMKESAGIGFWKGSLMKDPENIMVKPGDNSQAVRMIKYTNAEDIQSQRSLLLDYVNEAVEIEKAGLKVPKMDKEDLVLVAELVDALNANDALKKAFESLTPGRQRAYNLFFSAPKQSQTKISRIEKCVPRILEGKGLNDYN
ncbi:MAG TPA: YdeI/OmpD-associated family protein [Bacillota bacterium]|nr:YdeI/OmpD-associated family protein [Bacillota bacterium]